MPCHLPRTNGQVTGCARRFGYPQARTYIEAAGGKLHGFWYAFGEYDAYNLWEAPDNVSMAAVAMAISGGGALSKYETTVLLTVEETMDAMARARDIGYHPPGGVAQLSGRVAASSAARRPAQVVDHGIASHPRLCP
jgi:uncharacterized protein with GYD domain